MHTLNNARGKIRVFQVEDQALLRESLSTMLDLDQQIDVVGMAPNGEIALQQLETIGVDVVLMDIGLPGMDGIESTRRLKSKLPSVAVVMLTSYGDEYIDTAIEAGASGYILKSCTREQLVDAVKTVHEGHIPIDPAVTPRLIRELAEMRRQQRSTQLTTRQVDVLKLVAEGSRYEDVAESMFISKRTVQREVRAICDNLGVPDIAHAVIEAHRQRII